MKNSGLINKVLKYGKGLTVGLAIFVIVVGGLGFFSMQVLGRPVPMIFGQGAAIVLSGSMEPEISVNDLVLYSRKENYSAGDVVVFQDGGMTSVHRIAKRSRDQIITKGDANNACDEPITREQVFGKVNFVVPGAGALFEPGGIMTLVLAIILLEVLDVKRERSRKEMAYET